MIALSLLALAALFPAMPTSPCITFKVEGKCWYKTAPYNASFTTIIKYKREKFFYDFTLYDSAREIDRRTQGSFDGERSYRLEFKTGRLNIKSGNSLNHFDNFDVNPLFYLYSFLLVPSVATEAAKKYVPGYQMIPTTIWDLLSAARVPGAFDSAFKKIANTDKSVTLESSSVMDTFIGLGTDNTSVRVVLDEKGFPMKWEKVKSGAETPSGKHDFSMTFEVNKIGYLATPVGAMPYPLESKVMHLVDGRAINGHSMRITEIDLSDIDDSEFTVDPTQATYIDDQDDAKLISIPK